ncbi:HNH endonuclease [Hymenobacter fodinae]|uniref:HNH endonuclease n=1 Tax=Hymenobacter fodinae TaxID=2510796 RepID=A0A4Z0NZA6_9BACT|nr:NUMOD4 domain-containing protein [Hymenobacter fodinae]TGE03337.1 hypothetical protein EU556_25820 [Hymenobacter fodinae]
MNYETEIWKPIASSPGYAVSSLGRVKNETTGALRKLVNHRNGYLQIGIRSSNYLVHRLVALAHLPPVTGKDFVNHKDCDKHNNTLQNLEWVTKSENILHANQHGLTPIGNARAKHPRAKLSEEQVSEIRQLLAQKKLTQKEIGAMYSVTPSTVQLISANKNWSTKTVLS